MMKKSKVLMMALLVVGICLGSCTGDDGEQGPKGDQGVAGVDGQDGVNGTNGKDGEDGNANVHHVILDMTGHTGTIFAQIVPELTEEVISNYAILYYLGKDDLAGTQYYSIPGPVSADFLTQVYAQTQLVQIYFSNYDGTGYPVTASDHLESLRIVLIESTPYTTSKSVYTSVKDELKAVGVDIADYHAVAAYFGLE
ncbi:collagen-like protein [Allomuricauda sp. M10]|uniref:collagen-like protein n=1 Tax=Allomuricauda sp. M10 TaxID=2683292 RepID=UPI001D197BDF|nr:collagen-like protein [Muricauda sp. M10]